MLISKRNLYRVKILTLDVLDKSHLHNVFIRSLADICRDRTESCLLRSTETTFTSNNHILAILLLTKSDWLNDTDFRNRISQLLKCLFIKLTTRLIRIGIDKVERNLVYGRRTFSPYIFSRYQCIKSTTQCWKFLCNSHLITIKFNVRNSELIIDSLSQYFNP